MAPSLSIPRLRRVIRFTRRPAIMGIVNVTPDSFSDGGAYETPECALEHALRLIKEGADIIDIGGESTRPGAYGVSADIECERVLPVIRALRCKTKKLISIDTTKSLVAEEALKAGADVVNDVSALRKDCNMGTIVAKAGAPIVLMHRKGRNAKEMQKRACYGDVIQEIIAFFRRAIRRAGSFGIAEESIILDPGLGFGKNIEHNVEILKALSAFSVFQRPIMIGASRKSFLGHLAKEDDPKLRLGGSLAAAIVAMIHGAHILRVHDVAETRQACRIVQAVL